MLGRSVEMGLAPTPSCRELDDWDGAADALPRSYPQKRSKVKMKNSFVRIHGQCIVIQYNITLGAGALLLGACPRRKKT